MLSCTYGSGTYLVLFCLQDAGQTVSVSVGISASMIKEQSLKKRQIIIGTPQSSETRM